MNHHLLFSFFIIILFSQVVCGESGTLRIEAATGSTYSPVSGAETGTANFNLFIFRADVYNTITKVEFDSGAGAKPFTYNKESNYSTFTITDGGTGGGYVSYNKNDHKIIWVFNEGTTIDGIYDSTYTNYHFNVSYSNDFFVTDIVATDTNQYTSCTIGAGQLTAAQPFYIHAKGRHLGSCERSGDYVYNVQTKKIVDNSYVVSYAGDAFIYSIDKSAAGNLATQIRITNMTHLDTYMVETTYNNVSFTGSDEYNQGIRIFMNDSAGNYDIAYVNYTGSSVPTPIPTATEPATGTGASIVFDKSSYYIGDNVNFSWYLSDDAWGLIGTKQFEIYENNELKLKKDIGAQNGHYIYKPSGVGTLKVIISNYISIIVYDLIDSSQVSVLDKGLSYISLPNSIVPFRDNITVDYFIGFSVASYPAATIEIRAINKESGNTADTVFLTGFPSGRLNLSVVRVVPEGNYTVEMYDWVQDTILDRKDLQVVRVPGTVPTVGITTPSISMDRTNYFYNDFASVTFATNDTYFAAFDIRGEVMDINNSLVTKRMYNAFSEQVGAFDMKINYDRNVKCERAMNCWFNPGNNSLRLIAYNSTHDFILAMYNFTVSDTTSDGWGLRVSTQTPPYGEQFIVTTIVPSGYTGYLRIEDSGYSANKYSVFNSTVGAGTTTFQPRITRVNVEGKGYYDVVLYSGTTPKIRIPITVTRAEGAPTSVPSAGQASSNMANTLLYLMSTAAFWGIMIFFSVVITVAYKKGADKNTGMVAFILANLLAIVGLWDPFTWYILIVSWLGAGTFFVTGRRAATGD